MLVELLVVLLQALILGGFLNFPSARGMTEMVSICTASCIYQIHKCRSEMFWSTLDLSLNMSKHTPCSFDTRNAFWHSHLLLELKLLLLKLLVLFAAQSQHGILWAQGITHTAPCGQARHLVGPRVPPASAFAAPSLPCSNHSCHIKSHQIKITTFLQKFWVLLIFFVVCRFPLPVPLFYRFFCLLPVKHLCFQSPLLCSDEFPLTFPKTVRLWQEKCKKCMKFKNRWLLKPKVQKLRKVAEAEFVVA